jgi:RHS repeat-associated protein
VFDEQFNYVSGNSGYEQVAGSNTYSTHSRSSQAISKNGYLYIYVSNSTPNIDVFFDNLQVTHIRGPLLEENHYYPFGLTMAGISSKAAKAAEYPQNNKKFTTQELDDDLGWNIYQFIYRGMDPQIGRFIQIDPLATKYASNSTYSYAENKVTIGIDLEGLELLPVNSAWFRVVSEQKQQLGPPMYYWAQHVDVVASNVPGVFKDPSGSPLFSASSVNVGPNGKILTGNEVGPRLMPGNSLPSYPAWTWGDGPKNPTRTASTGGWNMGTNLGDNKAFGDQAGAVAGAPAEAANWIELYTHDKPIWDAYNSLNTNENAFNSAVDLVNSFEKGFVGSMGGYDKASIKGDLVNFVQDGSLPKLDFKNLKGTVENSLTTMWFGIQILNNSGSKVQQSTLDTYNALMTLYNALNPSYNFNLNQVNNKK